MVGASERLGHRGRGAQGNLRQDQTASERNAHHATQVTFLRVWEGGVIRSGLGSRRAAEKPPLPKRPVTQVESCLTEQAIQVQVLAGRRNGQPCEAVTESGAGRKYLSPRPLADDTIRHL